MPETSGLKRRLRDGEAAVGCWLWLNSGIAAELMSLAGYDCAMIDLEHGFGTLGEAVQIMHALRRGPTAPLMRVPANDPVWLKRALDTGVEGVMIPAVDSVADAEAAVRACRYPPAGERGMAVSVVRAADYGHDWQSYLERADEDLVVIVQIETRGGVDGLEGIAAVEGVDMLFIGPFDLSASLGHSGEPDHPEVHEVIQRIEQAARDAGKMLGSIPTPKRPAAELIARGYNLVLADGDLTLLRDAAAESVRRIRRGD